MYIRHPPSAIRQPKHGSPSTERRQQTSSWAHSATHIFIVIFECGFRKSFKILRLIFGAVLSKLVWKRKKKTKKQKKKRVTSCLNTLRNLPNKSVLDCASSPHNLVATDAAWTIYKRYRNHSSGFATRNARHARNIWFSLCVSRTSRHKPKSFDVILQDKLPASVKQETFLATYLTLPRVKEIRDQHRSIQDPRLS